MLFYGGGIRVPLGPSWSAFADARFAIVGESGEAGAMVLVRAGLAGRF